ncbi:MAG: hypothetical protein AB2L22_16985 [Syntrophales bacterium]
MNKKSKLSNIDDLWVILRRHIEGSDFLDSYLTELAFESDVWARVVEVAVKYGLNKEAACLTSHRTNPGRSPVYWEEFCKQEKGPDVNVLGSNNRLDIVFKHPEYGSIGIEVKCLGTKGHAAKLTQGIGQMVLALAHRDRTILVIHCGTVSSAERQRLREVSKKICKGTRMAVIVVPAK